MQGAFLIYQEGLEMRRRDINFELRRGPHTIAVRRNPRPLKGYLGFIDGIEVASGDRPYEALRRALDVLDGTQTGPSGTMQ